MTLTRTRLIVIGIVAALAVLAVALSAVLGGGGESDSAPGTAASFGVPIEDGEKAFSPGELPASLLTNEAYDYAARNSISVSGSADAPAPESPPSDPQLQGLLDRKIIQSTSVDIEVKEVGREFQEIIRIAEVNGGFVANSSFSNVDDTQIADLTIRVPADRYQAVLAQIRDLAEVVTRESSDANDVTEEYTDLQARLRALEATERRYLELLGRADTINDILVVQDRLDSVRTQIEQVQGRINLLEHLTDLTTITVHLRPLDAPPPPVDDGAIDPLDAAAGAWDRSLDALRGIAVGVLVAGAFSWWLLPPVAALGFGLRWWLGRRRRPATEHPAL